MNAKPNVNLSSNSPVCQNETLNLYETGGEAASWTWTGPNSFSSNIQNPTRANMQVSDAGTYTVVITDIHSCTNTSDISISVNTIPIINIDDIDPLCEGENINLTETGGDAISWDWTGPNGFTSTDQNPEITNANTSNSGSYYLSITDINSCTNSANTSITVNANPTANIEPASIAICEGESTELVASGDGTYAWSHSSETSASVTVNPITETTYTVTVTNTNNCSASASSIVSVNPNPTASIEPASIAICEGESTELVASGDGTYAWSHSSETSASVTVNPITETTYTVTVTNTNNCSASASSIVSVNQNPTANIEPANIAICEGESTELVASGDGTYAWSHSSETSASVTVNPITETTYTVTVTNTNNCSASASSTVSVNQNPTANITPANIAICEGESTELVASGDGTYAWSHSSETSASVTVNPITETTYTVTVTNTNNCSASASSTVSVNPNPDIPVATIDCTGGVDQGIITLTSPTGANYEYSIGGTFQASTSFGPLVNGDYTITVNDINTACSSTGSPIDLSCGCINPPTLSLSSTSDQICGISDYVVAGNSFGGSATEVTISHNGNGNLDIASSTTSPFDFTYTPASTDLGGNITITVITNNPDGDPCTPAEQEFTLSVLEIPEINISSNSPVCVGQDINLSEDAGDANVWQWTGPNGFTSSEQNPSILDANLTNEGDYNLTITGNNSCTNSATITINVNNNPTINASNDGPVCEGTDIQLFATGSEDVNYLWTGPNSFTSTEQNPILTNTLVNQEGDYTVLVIDPVTNCLASAITEVIINENPDIPTANIDCISGLGQITITSPLGADYEYSIGSSFQANTIFENLDNGNYTIIVNNVNTNCSSVSEVLTIDCGCTNEPSLTLSENTGEICGNQAFTLDGNSFGGSATQVNITHNGSGEIDETNITSSDFSFTYTPSSEDYGNTVIITIITDNPQGEPCQVASATFSLDVLDIPNIIANNSSPICKGEDIDLTESGNEAISWSWTGPNGFNSDMQNPTITEADVFANGTYTVTGTDAKGCTNSATTIVIVSIPTEITFVEYLCADTLPIFLNANIQGGTWSGNGIIDANTGEFDPEIAGDGEHTITYTLLNPCGNTTTTTIRVYPRANAEILPVDTLFLSDLPIFVETVEAGGIWSGTAIDEIIGEFTPNIAGIGDHQVFYTIEEPCGDIDSTIIIVIPDIIPDLLIPDVLTPNNDGYNDTWRIQGIQAFEKIEIYIFNRWGDEVFTYTGSGFDYHDPAKQWDGTYKGKLLPFGTYVYVLILENETSYKGTISLIR